MLWRRAGQKSNLGKGTVGIASRNTASYPMSKTLEMEADDIVSSLSQAIRNGKNKTEGFIKKEGKKKVPDAQPRGPGGFKYLIQTLSLLTYSTSTSNLEKNKTFFHLDIYRTFLPVSFKCSFIFPFLLLFVASFFFSVQTDSAVEIKYKLNLKQFSHFSRQSFRRHLGSHSISTLPNCISSFTSPLPHWKTASLTLYFYISFSLQ